MKKYISNKNAPWFVIALLAVLFVLLRSDGFSLLIPDAIYDDALQYSLSHTLSQGHWLGHYNSLTLAKGIVYPFWLAVLHTLDVPLWLGQALLYAVACAAVVFAVRQLIRHRWLLPILFGLLIFNPMTTDRVYREAIAASLLLLVITWLIGITVATFYKGYSPTGKKRDFIIYNSIGIFSLPLWWYLREDSFWTIPYIALTLAAVLIAVWIRRKTNRLGISIMVVAPVLAVLAVGLVIGLTNQRVYGRFVVNDYTSPEFRSAYGALTRIHNDFWQPTVPVSDSMRQKAYGISPAFATLKPCLDSGTGYCEGFKTLHVQISNNDYEGGWFFWALRIAAERQGYYKTPKTAEQFYITVAQQINQACDSGAIKCDYGKRATLAPPFRKEIIPSVYDNTVIAASQLVRFYDISSINPDTLPGFDSGKQQMADYYNVRYQADQLNLSAHLKLLIRHTIGNGYKTLNGIVFIVSFAILIASTVLLVIRRHKKIILHPTARMLIIICWFLLLSLLLARLIMLAYVTTTSFPAVNPFYMGSISVVMLLFEGLTLAILTELLHSYQKSRRNLI